MVWGMLDSMNYFIRHTYEDIEQWDVLATFSSPQTTATLEKVRGWPGVQSAEAAIQAPATLSVNGQEEDVLLTALRAGQEMHRLQLPAAVSEQEALSQGRFVLTDALAEKLGVEPGDEVTVDTPLGSRSLELGATTDELLSSAAYISLEEAQRIVGAPAPVFNAIYLRVEPGQGNAVRDELYGLPGAAGVQLKSEARRDVESLMGLFYAFMGIMLLFAVAMAFALIFNAMTVNVLERQRELATMRAVGAGGGRIAAQIAAENVVLWLLALVPGLLLGRLVAGQMGEAFSADLFTFAIVIAPVSYVLTAAGVLLTMLVAALPAIRRINHLDLAQATKVLT
jgi:putative ABC transport system permease protein